ncbi:MAG: hypothetical protein SPE11_10010 [Parabacteroides sp.]|nr:hypothetical protein [Parabacteroides sp.]
MATNDTALTTIQVDEVKTVIQSAPDALQKNSVSVQKCQEAGQSLLDTIESTGGIQEDALDAEVEKYLKRTKVTVDNMNTRRKPITQLLNTLAKTFTSMEAAIDVKSANTVPGRLQRARDDYARRKLEAQKRREEEARRKQQVEQEMGTYRADIASMLESTYVRYIDQQMNRLTNLFNSTTLATYNEQAEQVKNFSTAFDWNDFATHCKDNSTTFYIDAETKKRIKIEVVKTKRTDFAGRYEFEISEMKQSFIDRLPSLKKQLEEQEELRKTNAEAAARAEAERKQQEAEAQMKREQERKRKEEEAKAKAAADRAAAEVQAAFAFGADTQPATPTKAKVKKRIRVLNPQGFLHIYQLWFQREGVNLSMEDLEKVHKKMITYCEKLADKEGETIQSDLIRYEDEVKAK